MALLFDTTVLVDAERATTVALDDLVDDDDDVAVAAITIAEMSVGVALASGRRRVARRAFLDDVIETIPVLPYDISVADAHAELLVAVRQAGRPRGAHDLIIAATALSSGRSVVTADRAAFLDLPGVVVVAVR